MVLNTTFNYISVISWRWFLLGQLFEMNRLKCQKLRDIDYDHPDDDDECQMMTIPHRDHWSRRAKKNIYIINVSYK
jgi:hypothetical protein